MPVAIKIEAKDIERLNNKLAALAGLDTRPLLPIIGAMVESQTRKRISEEGPGPDDEDWPEWSTQYAESRAKKHKLLQSSGSLIDSLGHLVTGNEVEIGTNLVYGAIHQFGGTIKPKNKKALRLPGGKLVKSVTIPARPYLGISEENENELLAVVDSWIDKQIGLN